MQRNSPSQGVSPFAEEVYVEQVKKAYMLKRDHPKFKGNWISATGASKSECSETHRVKAFRRLQKKSDVEQVAKPYMLKRDWLVLKSACLSRFYIIILHLKYQ